MFYLIKNRDLGNHADDSTECLYSDHDPRILKSVLANDNLICVNWFSNNQMRATPHRYQVVAVDMKSRKGNGCILQCEDEVKLFGVTIDFKLKCNVHVSNIFKTSRQLVIINGIVKNLCNFGKLNIY